MARLSRLLSYAFGAFGALALALALAPGTARAHSPRDLPSEDKPPPAVNPAAGEEELFSIHFQATYATQWHPAFHAPYSGTNSLIPTAESATALVSTLYADLRLWPGCELLFDPEVAGGTGLSATHGVAAFPGGIVYRVGDPAPVIYVARLALSQSFGLGGGNVIIESGPNELAGHRDRDQLAITVGRLSVTDVFDANRWAHDPTTRFFNWALFASGAWDYPADTRGYTYGILVDLSIDDWSARAGFAVEPKSANASVMDWRLDKAHALMAEYERRYALGNLPGAVSLLAFLNVARMGSYAEVLANPAAVGNDVANTRKDGRTKYGLALSAEQQLTHGLGAFLRLSINDGQNESWAFTEIDRSFAIGAVQSGELWGRSRDEAGAALVINGLSDLHARYLAGGGLGFILGDGALSYAAEMIADIYYRVALAGAIDLSFIYQPIIDPAYNTARGPVHVLTGRLHVAL
jgi:high affinity Mn2+ porin